MTREELREHCQKQIEGCEMWARYKGEEPHGKVYEEHKLILELLEQETVSKEVYDHEYFLRKELELKIDKLQRQLDKTRAEIAELDNKVCQQFLIEDVDKEVHHAYQDCLEIIDKYKAEEAEAHPINENIAKGFEEFTKMMFRQGQAGSEE